MQTLVIIKLEQWTIWMNTAEEDRNRKRAIEFKDKCFKVCFSSYLNMHINSIFYLNMKVFKLNNLQLNASICFMVFLISSLRSTILLSMIAVMRCRIWHLTISSPRRFQFIYKFFSPIVGMQCYRFNSAHGFCVILINFNIEYWNYREFFISNNINHKFSEYIKHKYFINEKVI